MRDHVAMISCVALTALSLLVWHLSCASNRNPSLVDLTADRMWKTAALCKTYRRLTGYWPTNTASITTALLVTNQSVLLDEWGHPFGLYTDSSGRSLYIVTYGADGLPGGLGSNADGVLKVR